MTVKTSSMTRKQVIPDGENVIPDPIGDLKRQKSAKFFKKILHFYFLCLYLQSQMKGKPNNRGVAQLASASGLGPEGPVFESQYPDIFRKQLLGLQVVAFSCYAFCSAILFY